MISMTTIAEYHGYVPAPGGDVQARAVNFSADQKNFVCQITANIGVRSGETIKEAGALLSYVEGRCRLQTEFVLQQASGSRKENVVAQGCKYYQVNVFGLPSGTLHGNFRGLQPKIR